MGSDKESLTLEKLIKGIALYKSEKPDNSAESLGKRRYRDKKQSVDSRTDRSL